MSYCRDLCFPCTNPRAVVCPQPCTNTCNEPCVVSCEDSEAIIYPPPVVVTMKGPILKTCPQRSVVGSSKPIDLCRSLTSTPCLGSGCSDNAVCIKTSIGSEGSNDNSSACNYKPCNFGCSYQGKGVCNPCCEQQCSSNSRRSCGPC